MKNLSFIGASNYCVTPNGELFSLRTMSIQKGWVNVYRTHSITFDDGTCKQVQVHRLVAQAFIPNPENKKYVNHKDGNKLNNSISNLEWVTPSENNLHAHATGLTCGKKPHSESANVVTGSFIDSGSSFSGLNEEDVRLCCSLISQGYRDVDIARMINIPRRTINYMRHKDPRCYPEIVSEYNFNFTKEERLSPEQVISVCEDLQSGMKVMDISRKYNMSRKKVERIKHRISFTDISKSYVW